MKIHILGAHNCESKDTKLTSLVIDGRLVLDAGGLTSGLSLSDQEQLKAVLLTHQHYDHVRDIMALAMNFYLAGSIIDIYAASPACEAISAHLLDGALYPDFRKLPPEKPTIRLNEVEPYRTMEIEGYEITAVPVNHSVPVTGYQVVSGDGGSVFFTGDTGPGLRGCWENVSPRLIVAECTASNRFDKFAGKAGHLTPALLGEELAAFREVKGYLPQVVTVHMSPNLEKEIRAELVAVAGDLGCLILAGYEGMVINL